MCIPMMQSQEVNRSIKATINRKEVNDLPWCMGTNVAHLFTGIKRTIKDSQNFKNSLRGLLDLVPDQNRCEHLDSCRNHEE